MRRKGRTLTGFAAAAMVLAGCGSPGAPVDPAPVGQVVAPQPAGVGGTDPPAPAGQKVDCGNPLASLPPSADVPAGSTMDTIKRRGKLVAGVDQTTFLFGYRDPNSGELEGFDIDMVKQVAKRLFGTDEGHVQYKAISSADRENALKEHRVDIVVRTMTVNCQRRLNVEFSSVYYVAGQRVLVPAASKVTGLDQLGGQKVCATGGSTSLKQIAAISSRPVPVAVQDWSDCVVLLQQDQVQAISTDDTILAGMSKQDPNTKIVGKRITDEPYGIGIPKENQDMVRFVNSVLEDVRKGPWQESYNKYLRAPLGEAQPPPPTYR